MNMNSKMPRPRAVLLDFYGTVVEEAYAPIAYVSDEIAKASSKPVNSREIGSYWSRIFSETYLNSYGSSFQSERELGPVLLQELLLHFDANLDIVQLTQALYNYWDEYWLQPAIFPESRDVIANCGVPVCLVSNVDNSDLVSALKHSGLSFDLIVTSEDCRAYKPRPEPFEKALSLLGLSNKEVLHVGDSLGSDVRGAKALGIPVLWLNRKGRELPADQERPDYVSTDLTGILDIMS